MPLKKQETVAKPDVSAEKISKLESAVKGLEAENKSLKADLAKLLKRLEEVEAKAAAPVSTRDDDLRKKLLAWNPKLVGRI